jgi:hypothetical protein
MTYLLFFNSYNNFILDVPKSLYVLVDTPYTFDVTDLYPKFILMLAILY